MVDLLVHASPSVVSLAMRVLQRIAADQCVKFAPAQSAGLEVRSDGLLFISLVRFSGLGGFALGCIEADFSSKCTSCSILRSSISAHFGVALASEFHAAITFCSNCDGGCISSKITRPKNDMHDITCRTGRHFDLS